MKGTMLTFGLGIKWVSQQWNIEYSSHSGLKMHGKKYVTVNMISSGNAVGKKTGCLITADGSEDAKITPEGLADYHVPLPLSYLPACEANLRQTLQIKLKMMKRNKERKH